MATPGTAPNEPQQQPVTNQPSIAPAGGQAIPPVPPQQAAQAVQTLFQASFMPAPPAHPETVKHLVDFLKHDSDNRHAFSEKEGERRFRLKRNGMLIAGGLAAVLISIPLIALLLGQREFVSNFLDRQLPYLIGLAAAFIGGMGAKNIFK